MKKIDAFRQGIAETGSASDDELSAYIEQRFGVRIDPMHIPLFRASDQDLQRLVGLRAGRGKDCVGIESGDNRICCANRFQYGWRLGRQLQPHCDIAVRRG